MNIQALIEQLNKEGEILNQKYEDNEFRPGETMHFAAYILGSLRDHVDELLPYMRENIQQGLKLGPPPEGHDSDHCSDCQWYESSVRMLGRINQGEFDYSSN